MRPGMFLAELTVAPGECVAVMGPSGAGKSLLLRAIADLDSATGKVRLDGVDRESMSAPQWRQQVAYLASDAGWWADTVAEHFIHWGDATVDAAALGLPAEAGSWLVARLSSGERQRLALIRILAGSPRVLLLDEPTANLDEAVGLKVESLLRDRLAADSAIVLVTHDRVQARRLCGRLMMVEQGQVRHEAWT